jgi:hypothetical protein
MRMAMSIQPAASSRPAVMLAAGAASTTIMT